LQEETTSILEEGVMENIPENGVQPLPDVIVEQRSEEDTPTLHLELEDSEDTNIHEIREINMSQSEEVEQDVEDMVSNIRNVSSYFFLRLKKKVMLLFCHLLLYYIS